MKEFVWVCGIIPEDVNNEIKEICLKENEDLSLSERFFRFNLHISLKRTFYTEEFDQVKDDLKELLSAYKRIDCGNTYLVKNSDMLWLRISDATTIQNGTPRTSFRNPTLTLLFSSLKNCFVFSITRIILFLQDHFAV